MPGKVRIITTGICDKFSLDPIGASLRLQRIDRSPGNTFRRGGTRGSGCSRDVQFRLLDVFAPGNRPEWHGFLHHYRLVILIVHLQLRALTRYSVHDSVQFLDVDPGSVFVLGVPIWKSRYCQDELSGSECSY